MRGRRDLPAAGQSNTVRAASLQYLRLYEFHAHGQCVGVHSLTCALYQERIEAVGKCLSISLT
jgi:hypothetical protein